jgi:predicted ABC-type sugar transport system permease subunit
LSGSRVWSADAANAGEALVTSIAVGAEIANKDATVKVFRVVSFITMLLGLITGLSGAGLAARLVATRLSQ